MMIQDNSSTFTYLHLRTETEADSGGATAENKLKNLRNRFQRIIKYKLSFPRIVNSKQNFLNIERLTR